MEKQPPTIKQFKRIIINTIMNDITFLHREYGVKKFEIACFNNLLRYSLHSLEFFHIMEKEIKTFEKEYNTIVFIPNIDISIELYNTFLDFSNTFESHRNYCILYEISLIKNAKLNKKFIHKYGTFFDYEGRPL
jgi:hypothetical protein